MPAQQPATPDASHTDPGYLDLNLTYGWRGWALTAGLMKRRTGAGTTGWYAYLGGGFGSSGWSRSVTLSPNSVSTGWNRAISLSDGARTCQAGVDRGDVPFVEAGVGGPRGGSVVAYYAWPLPVPAEAPGDPLSALEDQHPAPGPTAAVP